LLLVVDNGSVYTQSLVNCIRELGVDFEHHIFSNLTSKNFGKYLSILLSGRKKNDPLMNAVNSSLIKHSLLEHKPLLGICYGAEILALTLGGTIKKMTSSRHGLFEVGVINSNPLCQGKIQVFESHSYMVSKLDSSFAQIATSTDCRFEIFQYDKQNIFGTQFHPEMSDDGKTLLERFTSIK
jgi:GMP synthase (glutamine-hydrolysing)